MLPVHTNSTRNGEPSAGRAITGSISASRMRHRISPRCRRAPSDEDLRGGSAFTGLEHHICRSSPLRGQRDHEQQTPAAADDPQLTHEFCLKLPIALRPRNACTESCSSWRAGSRSSGCRRLSNPDPSSAPYRQQNTRRPSCRGTRFRAHRPCGLRRCA